MLRSIVSSATRWTSGPSGPIASANTYIPLQTAADDGGSYLRDETGAPLANGSLDASSSASERDVDRQPTKRELRELRRIPGRVPWPALVIAMVELAERSSYYGCLGVFPNFIQRPLPAGSITGAPRPTPSSTTKDGSSAQAVPGALGRGLRTASAIITVFSFLAYLWPIAGGLIADLRLNKFRTIVLGVGTGLLAHIILVYAASPGVLVAGRGMPPFLISLLLLSFSTGMSASLAIAYSSTLRTVLNTFSTSVAPGAVKSNIAPLMCDQILGPDLSIHTLDTGEIVLVDKSLTIQRTMNIFYACINVGAFVSAVTSFAEKYVGFWLAFAIPGFIFLAMPILLYTIRPHLLVTQPSGSPLVEVVRIIKIAYGPNSKYSTEDRWQAAKSPALGGEQATGSWRSWDDAFVDELRGAMYGCRIFFFFPIYYLCMNGLSSLVTSLTGSMTTHGVPNDFFSSLNSISIIVAIPLFTYYLYPELLRHRVPFGPIVRVIVGFAFAATGYAYAAFLQWRVYQTSPCGFYATKCDVGTGVSPLNAWWTAPIPILAGVSEVLANVTGLEIAYNQAPKRLKSFVTALFLFSSAISSAIVLAITPTFKDPYLVWPFLGVSLATFGSAIAIHRLFRDEQGEEGGKSVKDYELEDTDDRGSG